VRVLEALQILEAATVECKVRPIDTPGVREALDLVEPICQPMWYVDAFRDHLAPVEEFGPSTEGQQQNLRVNFTGIHRLARQRIIARLGWLGARYCKTKNPVTKAEIDRLNGELAKLPAQWTFFSGAG
jgi:hypothetical protein